MNMKLRQLALAPIAAVVMALSAPVNSASNSLTFQGVTFESTVMDSDTLSFSILNATSATGNWAGINYLKAFEIKNIGNVTAAIISPNNLTPVDRNLNANGCGGPAGSAGLCFLASTPIALTDLMTWTIDFTGTNLNLYGVTAGSDPTKADYGITGPHLKVDFYASATQSKATGDLLSMNLSPSPVPEPEIYAMLSIGLGLMGWVGRKKKLREAVTT
jgi:hypothetical protein